MKNKTIQFLLSLLFLLTLSQGFAVEKVTFYHNDLMGSPVAATDSNGELLWREAYRPYGSRIKKADISGNTVWYTGKQEDSDLGLSYFGARWYDPEVGRFMGMDPVGFDEGNMHSFNRYGYGNNNPYMFFDPDGNAAVLAVFAYYGETLGVTTHYWVSKAVGNDVHARRDMYAVVDAVESDTRTMVNSIADNPADIVLGRLNVFGKVAKEGTTRVGRWMSKAEHEKMVDTGKVIESKLGGVTSVTTPPNSTAWIRQTDGSRFVEFDVLSSVIRAKDGISGKIYGPNSIFGPKKGITEMPSATNIQQTVSKWPRVE